MRVPGVAGTPTQCVLIGCREKPAKNNAFCSEDHFNEANRLTRESHTGGTSGWEWTRPKLIRIAVDTSNMPITVEML